MQYLSKLSVGAEVDELKGFSDVVLVVVVDVGVVDGTIVVGTVVDATVVVEVSI